MNQLAQKAHNTINRLIRIGSLIRPALCSQCGKYCNPDAHHPDYNKPSFIVWLCKSCHNKEHPHRERIPGQIKTLTICSIDIIKAINKLAENHKDPDEAPNPHRTARRILREGSNAALHYPDLYEQLMDTVARLDSERKKKTA